MTDEPGRDDSRDIAERVSQAAGEGCALRPAGSGSKAFLGHPVDGEPLDLSRHSGLVTYEPTELVVTARAGTPLAVLDAALAAEGQMLPFDPPRFGGGGTLGGAVAAGLSGPSRPFRGAVRDSVLGARVVNGRGEVLRFGGEVMKNVAGYDGARLMAGAQGTLGVLLDISLKLAPRPARDVTVALDQPPTALHEVSERCLHRGLPLTGAAHDGERLRLRLAGADEAVQEGAAWLGGETSAANGFWDALRDHDLPFFAGDRGALWRLALPPGASLPDIPGERILDWAGRQLWLASDAPADELRDATAAVGGHATCYRSANGGTAVFTPLSPALAAVHRRLKTAFDPSGILNPGRLYPGLC